MTLPPVTVYSARWVVSTGTPLARPTSRSRMTARTWSPASINSPTSKSTSQRERDVLAPVLSHPVVSVVDRPHRQKCPARVAYPEGFSDPGALQQRLEPVAVNPSLSAQPPLHHRS